MWQRANEIQGESDLLGMALVLLCDETVKLNISIVKFFVLKICFVPVALRGVPSK